MRLKIDSADLPDDMVFHPHAGLAVQKTLFKDFDVLDSPLSCQKILDFQEDATVMEILVTSLEFFGIQDSATSYEIYHAGNHMQYSLMVNLNGAGK